MVNAIERTVSKTTESEPLSRKTTKTTSVDSRYMYSDPDFLIREYFLSSPAQRAKLRKLVFQNIKSWESVREILVWSRRNEISDAYDGASDLLAECTDISLLESAVQYLKTASLLASSSSINRLSNLDAFWEVLIKGLAYAYQIPAKDRLLLIHSLLSVTNIRTRIFNAAIIDAFVILADEIDMEQIRNSLEQFSSPREPDLCIRKYAREALQEIS